MAPAIQSQPGVRAPCCSLHVQVCVVILEAPPTEFLLLPVSLSVRSDGFTFGFILICEAVRL